MNIAEQNRQALVQSEQAGMDFVNQHAIRPSAGSQISTYGPAQKELMEKTNFLQRLFPSAEYKAERGAAREQDSYNAAVGRREEETQQQFQRDKPNAMGLAMRELQASDIDPAEGARIGRAMYGAENAEELNAAGAMGGMSMNDPRFSEQAQMAEQQAMLEQEQDNMFRSNQIAAQEQALNPLAVPKTPTEQLAAATDADALARIQANRPVPNYGTQTTMLNPYSNREQVIPHVGTDEFNKVQGGIDAGVRLIGQFQNMQSLIKDMGPTGTDYFGEDAKRFDTQRGLMATEMAILQELGVLSESDIELVLAGAEDVTSFGNNLEATILGPFASAGSLFGAELIKGTSLAGYDEIQRFVEGKITDYYKRKPYVDIDNSKLSQRMRLQLEPPER